MRLWFRSLVLGFFLLLFPIWLGLSSPARAVIVEQEEKTGQVLYQARQSLRDPSGRSWQVIAFKRVQPDDTVNVYLRLVGFPGTVDLAHPHPLVITTSLGQELTARDVTDRIFPDTDSPNVGQYDLQAVLPSLRPEIPVKLSLVTTDNTTINLFVPSPVLQEWATVAAMF